MDPTLLVVFVAFVLTNAASLLTAILSSRITKEIPLLLHGIVWATWQAITTFFLFYLLSTPLGFIAAIIYVIVLILLGIEALLIAGARS